MNKKKIFAALLIIGGLVAAYVWFFVYNKAHVDYQNEEASFVGHSDTLHKKAKTNQEAFMKDYLNKAVEIEGVVVEVGSSSFNLGSGMICTVDSAFSSLLPKIGETVVVKGRVVGVDEDILTADLICSLDKCVIVSNN